MEIKTDREPEGERHTEDHDDVAESTEMKNETERIDFPCPDPCLPCDKTVNSRNNPNMHEASRQEARNSCVLSGRTARTESNLKGLNVSQHIYRGLHW